MPRRRSRASRGPVLALIITIIGSISSTAALALFIADRLHLLPFQLFPGYEGTYMQFAGYSTKFPYEVLAKTGDPPPAEASEWTISPSYINVDPDEYASGVQNLIAAGLSFNGRIETTPYGTAISDGPVKYTKSWSDDGKIYTKTVEARIYYFIHRFYLTTKFDENLFLWFGKSEKGCPVQSAAVYIHTSVVDWMPRGNDTTDTGAWILAVEVAEVKYWRTDNTGSGAKLAEGVPDGATASLGIAQGQTLPLSSSMKELGGPSGVLGPSYISELTQRQPDRISPDPRLRSSAYVPIAISSFGALGGGCYSPNPLLVGNNPLAEIALRVHVLKVDSWIAVQTKGSEPKPPQPPGGESNPFLIWWRDLTYWFSTTFGVPIDIAGYVIIAIIVFFVFLFLLILLVAFAVRVGVSRHDIREVTGY